MSRKMNALLGASAGLITAASGYGFLAVESAAAGDAHAAAAPAAPSHAEGTLFRDISYRTASIAGGCAITGATRTPDGNIQLRLATPPDADYVGQNYGSVPDRAVALAGKVTYAQAQLTPTGYQLNWTYEATIDRKDLDPVGFAEVSISTVDASPAAVSGLTTSGLRPDELVSCGTINSGQLQQPILGILPLGAQK